MEGNFGVSLQQSAPNDNNKGLEFWQSISGINTDIAAQGSFVALENTEFFCRENGTILPDQAKIGYTCVDLLFVKIPGLKTMVNIISFKDVILVNFQHWAQNVHAEKLKHHLRYYTRM